MGPLPQVKRAEPPAGAPGALPRAEPGPSAGVEVGNPHAAEPLYLSNTIVMEVCPPGVESRAR